MQNMAASMAGSGGREYLALGSVGPDVQTTDGVLQHRALGADGRQGEAPVLALLGALHVKHQPAARVR